MMSDPEEHLLEEIQKLYKEPLPREELLEAKENLLEFYEILFTVHQRLDDPPQS